MELNKIYQGDVLEVLKSWPSDSIDCVITSPPYWSLRSYLPKDHPDKIKEIGLEPTFQEYLDKMMPIFTEVKRVMKPTGSFWLNMGDSYSAPPAGDKNVRGWGKEFQTKSLIGQPWRMAIRMQDELGFILRADINWCKQLLVWKRDAKYTMGSVMPSSVKDRVNMASEHLFHFTKSKKYFYDIDAIRIPAQTFENRPGGFEGSRTLKYDSKYLENYSPQQKQSGQRFNYRVRDAEKKAGNPQFKANEEEIKNYKQVHPDYGKAKLKGLDNSEKKGLNRWMSGTPNFTHRKSFEARMADTVDKDTFQSRAGNIKKLLSEVRLGIKPNTGMEKMSNMVGDPRGNHEGGPGSWRDFKNENESLTNPSGKNIPNNWLIGPEPSKEHHFAKFPTKLCGIPILATCPKDGIVCDIFMGSGTVAVVARNLGRKWCGIELNKDYIAIAEKKLKQQALL